MAIMEFRILGPTELWSHGQQRDLGSARVRAALAILLLTPRTIVPADALIDRLWDARPPPKARESLSVYMARLRACLRQSGCEGVTLAGRASGYVLDVGPETVDLHQFRRLRRQAAALTASGDHSHAALLLREADALWRGQALAGIRGDWVGRMRDGLEEERRAAILERAECDLELGRHGDLVGEMRGLLAEYPLDETFVALQMTALYRSGRPADALSLYRETRDRLVDEQGAEPGPELSALHQRILRRDPGLSARRAGSRPHGEPVPDTLPPEEREFVGRGPELALLTREHGDLPQVCVIEGMPGVGKTALAVRAARIAAAQHPDGTLYLNFHSHDASRAALDAGEALHRLLRMLSVPATQIPDPVGERAALWRAQLSRRRAVVILDDAARHDQIRPLLPVTGQCLILITARRRLPDIAGARLLVLDELPMDDAIALFSRITGPGMAPDPDEAATAVRMCGRLPLAIQLTAGRLGQRGSLTLADLIDELSRSPGRPASGGNAVVASPELRSAFDLSYRALDPEHQRLFRRMGVSPCAQFSLHGAAALAGGTLAEAEKAVTALLDHHLLARAGAGQFRCHDLIREFAAARAAATDPPGEQRQAVSKLLDYYLCAADRADRLLHPFRRRRPVSPAGGPSPSPALRTRDDAAAWLESEWRNIAQAAQHAGRHEWQRQCADLAHALAGFIEIHGHWVEALTAHTLALRASRDLADPARIAQSCLELSRASQQTGRHEDTLALAQEAAATYQSLGDPPGLAEALDQIGLIHQRGARSREALAYFLEAGTLFEEAGDEHGVADTLSHSGIACWHLGRYPDAMTHLRHALSLYRGAGDRRGEAKTLHNLGKMELHSGRHRDALASFESALQVFTEIGGAQNQAILYHAIGNVHHYKGGHEQGIASYRQALALYRDLSDLPDQASVLADIGAIYKDADCYDEALIHYEQAKSIAEEIGSPAEQVVALRGIADVRRASGGCSEALDAYRAVLRLAREIGDLYGEAKALEGMAEAALSTHKSYEARILFRQALDIFERLGVPEAESARIRLEVTDPVLARRTS